MNDFRKLWWLGVLSVVLSTGIAHGQDVTIDATVDPLAVTAEADLANLSPTDGVGVLIKTGATCGLWRYDRASSTAVDGTSVLNGPGGVGRFLCITSTGGVVSDLPAGGTQYQLLEKQSATDGDADWVSSLGRLTVASGTLADSTPIGITQTWTDGTEAMTAFDINVTDTASAAGSLLANFRLDGTSQMNLTKSGMLNLPTPGSAVIGSPTGSLTIGTVNGYVYAGNTNVFGASSYISDLGIRILASSSFAFSSDATSYGAADVHLRRDAASQLAVRNGTTAQSLAVYTTESASLSNYERLRLYGTAASAFTIASEAAGTGTARGIRFIGGSDGVSNYGGGGSSSNTAFGTLAFRSNTSGSNDTAFGSSSMEYSTTGANNAAFGHSSMYSNTSGASNVSVGQASLSTNESGSYNVAVGGSAGIYFGSGTSGNTTGVGNVLVGYSVRPAANAETNQIVIAGYTGSGIGAIGLGSNTTAIGNSSTTTTLLYGSLIPIGGVTSSEPAIKRSGTILQARLADDSAFTGIGVSKINQETTTAVNPTTTEYSTDNDFGIHKNSASGGLTLAVNDSGTIKHLAQTGTATATDGDTTPSVAGLKVLVLSQTAPTTITDFDDGVNEQIIYIHADDNTDISDGGDLVLDTGVAFTTGAGGGILTLINRSGTWYEVSRTNF